MTLRSLLALGLVALGVASARPARAAIIYGVSNGTTLIRFNSSTPGTVATIGTFSGAATTIDGIDFRAADGRLYGYSQAENNLVVIDTTTAATTLVSSFGTTADNPTLGFDFNPVVDRLRVVTVTGQNLRVDPGTGATTTDGNLNYVDGTEADPQVVGLGYTNSTPPSPRTPPPGTTLYGIDAGEDTLARFVSPNAGTLETVGSLGTDAGSLTGFDILVAGGTNIGFMATTPDIVPGATTTPFYTVNLATGASTFVGNINAPNVGAIAAAPTATTVPEPASLGLLCVGAAGAAAGRRLRRKG